MNREDIIQELKNRNYDVVSNDVYKNGVKLEAIIIKDDSRITPTVYTEPLIQHADSIKQAADMAERIYLENKSVDFDMCSYRKIVGKSFLYFVALVVMGREYLSCSPSHTF